MTGINRGIMIASALLLVAVMASACNQPYSQAPSVTNTPLQRSFFETAESPGMGDVERFTTETALAAMTPIPGLETETPIGITPQVETATPTPILDFVTTSTATLAVSGITSTATTVPSGTRPATYTLQRGEFPYCIARRFNVDPDELLSLNGISSGTTFYSGLTLKIPQTGNPFPGNRMLRNHPATYTVSSADETVYGVACVFGDIEPSRIAQENGISVDAALTAGQQLRIP
jgi:LysM repeat protein